MSKLTKEQITARRRRMQDEALKSVAKTEQLNIRIDEDSITRLYELAGKQGKPVGAMVREWILEKLQEQENPRHDQSIDQLIKLVSGLHIKLDKWTKHRKVS